MKATGKPLRGARVLVAEDEPLLAWDIMKELLQAGADVVGPAMSVGRALELAEKENLSCGLLDVQLRDGPVFPAAEVLRQKGAGIVFHTGRVGFEELKRDWPGAKVVMKPASFCQIIEAMTCVCACQRGAA
ncbi:MAG: response regulator [Rhodomicrobium sp.]